MEFSDWYPMPPDEGPPLPQKFKIYWPWYKPGNNPPGIETKYQQGDILYNPPDTADNFTITGFQTVNGILYYVFKQNQSLVTFTEPVSLVDNSTAWAKLS
jgi:hypothetical protein